MAKKKTKKRKSQKRGAGTGGRKAGKRVHVILPPMREQLIRAREATGKTQEEVAAAVEMDHTVLARVEKGAVKSSSFLPALCRYYGLEVPDPSTGYTSKEMRLIDSYKRLSEISEGAAEALVDDADGRHREAQEILDQERSLERRKGALAKRPPSQ